MRRCVLVDEMMNITFVSGVGMGWGGEGGSSEGKGYEMESRHWVGGIDARLMNE